MDIKQKLTELLKKETKHDVNLEIPPAPELGDFAFPCFSLAKILKKNPNQIAEELSKKIKADFIEKIEVKGPYLNFFIKKDTLSKNILKKILEEKDSFGASDLGKNKKALVEHTSINPNASPHVGRARNALIGDVITKLLKFQGYKVETHYFVNDVGKQIAMLVLGAEGKRNVKFDDLLEIYIDINKKVEKNPELEKEIFKLLKKLEDRDKTTVKKFRDIVKICIDGQIEILSELGINYDKFDYESDYLWSKETNNILKKLEKTKKLFKDEEGRYVLDQKEFNLAMKSQVLVLTRADGTSLYPLRDLAYTIDKDKGFDRNIIVLGEDQKLYFEQLKATLSLLKHSAPEVVHYSFVLLQEGKMSTRKGNLVLLEDFMKEAKDKAKKEILKRNKDIKKQDLEKLSEAIGFSAIKYSILKVSPEKNVTFIWEHAINFEGDTGPYLQYAYARISSIIRKYGKKIEENIDFSLLKHEKESNLIKKLAEFPSIVKESTMQLKPHLIPNYLYSLAQVFNEFYHSCPVLQEEAALKKARLVLIGCVKQTLKNGLDLLGIEILEKM